MGKSNNNSSIGSNKNPYRQTMLICLLASWIVLLVLAAILAFWQLPQQNSERIRAVATAMTANQVNALNTAITIYQQQAKQIGQQAKLIDYLQAQDVASLHALEKDYRTLLSNARSVQLIPLGPLGIAGLKRIGIDLRNSIEADMIRQISTTQAAKPEIYQLDGQWVISFAAPVFSADTPADAEAKPVGAVLLRVNAEFFSAVNSGIDSSNGQSNLQLSSPNNKRVVSSAGQTAENRYSVISTLDGNWEVQFNPSDSLITANSSQPTIIYILVAVCLLVSSLIIVIACLRLQKTLDSNFAKLLKYAETLKSKQKKEAPKFDIANFTEIAAYMATLRRIAAKSDKDSKPADDSKSAKAEESLEDALDLDGSIPDADIMNFDDVESLEDVLDLENKLGLEETALPEIPDHIFRAYDIRGIADSDLQDEVVYHIGKAIASEAIDQGQNSIILGCDGRLSSPRIKDAVCQGILATGCDVIDIGMVPSPLLYFATNQLPSKSGVMVTGSHNPAEYNGIKIVINGNTLAANQIQAIKQRITTQKYHKGEGSLHEENIEDNYIDTIIGDVAIAQPLKVVIDCGNAVAGLLAPRLIEELGCEIIPLYCDVDGNFPNHHPDPSIMDNLSDLIQSVKNHQADLGIALDGDADRIGVISSSGKIVLPDQLLMLFAQDVVSRNPGTDVIFDVKCTRNLNNLISTYGGRPIMWKSGHSYIKQKMQETGALLGGELSGHIFFKERWYGFDDGIYAAARLIEILSTSDMDLDAQLEQFPQNVSTPELHIDVSDTRKFELVDEIAAKAQFGDAKISDLDGIRADFPDGWGLVRASNTTPALTLRFEAEDDTALARIQQLFKEQLSAVDASLQFPF